MARALVAATLVAAHARGQIVGGTVVNKELGTPIPGVRVALIDSNAKKIFAETLADTAGMFMLEAPIAGTFRLAFVRGSYVLGMTELFPVTDTGFIQHRYLFDLPTDDVRFEFQVTTPVAPRPGNRPPRYPESLRSRSISGRVLAQFVVDTLGRADMKTFRVLSATDPDFATAVRDAVPLLRFSPALVGDRRVRQIAIMPFHFDIVP
ncbi:MAG TPA: TonB family protein [Gemmatimonadaceae bacterium]